MTQTISVEVSETAAGWTAHVRIEDERGATAHDVTVPRADLERLAPGAAAADLVHASVELLLEREPKESILSAFEIGAISRYFPEYEREIARRLLDPS